GEAEGTQATTQSGGGSEVESAPSSSSGGPVSVTKVTDPVRRAYIGKVDAVCGQIDPERSKNQSRVGTAADVAEASKAYDETIALGWKELRQIEAIPRPPGEDPLLEANVFEPIRGQLALRESIAKALAATDVPRLRLLRGELDNSTRTLTGFARGYGFSVCGEE
ncbi:MAG TPA: hypothetical protein VIJ21_09245, partial [Solirubrobacterales bacterium]